MEEESSDRKQQRLSGWGRTFVRATELRSEDFAECAAQAPLSRGLGRSYGDASLPPADRPIAASCVLADRILAFDESSGVLRAEAGLSLQELSRVLLPRGWFTPVSPGTQFVTLGGMVASDVHGKNHHVAGTFGRWVRSLRLLLADGRQLECSREQHAGLFHATLGGMGLTGHILEVEFQLERVPSAWIQRESFRLPDLDTLLDRLKESGKQWPLTVAWMDTITRRAGKTLGRGILFVGRWAAPPDAPARAPRQPLRLTMPLKLPSGLLNRFTLAQFNRAVYWSHLAKHRVGMVSAHKYFYPLDRLRRWNLAYGPKGVTQHQCVIPSEHGAEGIRALLEVLAETGSCSFLTVVKDCGAEGEGLLSFPRPGMSLALDLPIRKNTQLVVDRLNEAVIAHGGRIYLAKDGFTRAEHFAAMEPRLGQFLQAKRQWDPENRIASAQSGRLMGLHPRLPQSDGVEQEHEALVGTEASLTQEAAAPGRQPSAQPARATARAAP